MKTKIIITGGKVHEVGYRFFLADSANAYGIYNFRAYNTTVNNLQAVVVMVEGEEEDVKSYLGFVKENFPEHASVKEVGVKEYTGYIPTIDSFLLTFVAGQLNKGVPAILRIDEKQDKMLQKQDETIAVIKEESHKTRETVREESQETRETIVGESRMARDTLVEHLKNDIAEIRAEIAEIKEKIAG
ncbi:acylphosphatase [archaeon]|nr:acylphosphatase [archaeon]